MQRFFIELFYKGTHYAGFQVQDNANTIQAEVEKALEIYFKNKFSLTGSSRTDAGVHAFQNYFHIDMEGLPNDDILARAVYHINAILPPDIVIRRIFQVEGDLHCRFSAVSRTYEYKIYQHKNPFLADTAYFFPLRLEIDLLQQGASIISRYTDFESFAKRNSQVHTFNCMIHKSKWKLENGCYIYSVTANRFLRGMVKGLVGTMLKLGRKKIILEQFKEIIESKNSVGADFSVPSHGLSLINVCFGEEI
ncbi:MAG: tRNA pseudouridine(38-40) synthase TruA [Ferruginibacter sp.]